MRHSGLTVSSMTVIDLTSVAPVDGSAERKVVDAALRCVARWGVAKKTLEDAVTAELSEGERDALRQLLQRIASSAGLIPGVHPGLADGGGH